MIFRFLKITEIRAKQIVIEREVDWEQINNNVGKDLLGWLKRKITKKLKF